VSETPGASVADMAAWALCLAEIQTAVGPRVVEVGNLGFVEAVVDLEHPVPPAGTETNPERAAGRKKSVAAALPPLRTLNGVWRKMGRVLSTHTRKRLRLERVLATHPRLLLLREQVLSTRP